MEKTGLKDVRRHSRCQSITGYRSEKAEKTHKWNNLLFILTFPRLLCRDNFAFK